MSMTQSSETPSVASDNSSFLERRKKAERDKNLATWVNDEYKKCKSARLDVERRWYRNIELYNGQHWNLIGRPGTALAGKSFTPQAPPWRVRLTINRIKPMIRTELARVTSQKPNASVVPASSEDQDLFAAQAGEQLWESTYARLRVARKYRSAAWWLLVTGVGFMKAYWDADKVDRYANIKGDFCVEQITPFHIFVPDLTVEDIEDQPYVIHAQVLPILKVKEMYPQLKDINPSVVAQTELVDANKLKIQSNNKPDSCLVLEMWLKPGTHKEFPNGGLIRTVDTNVVYEYTDGLPYEHGEYPFIKLEHIPTGKFYTDSVIVDIDPLQRELNRTRSQIVENKNQMSSLKLAAPEGSVNAAKITSAPGQLVEYKPGFAPPTPLPVQSLPGYVLQEVDRILMDMEDISSQHQVSKGNVPPGVTAATAISYLQEKDDSVLSHTFSSIEEAFEKLAKQIVSLAVQYWSVERMVKVTGVDGSFDAVMLKGSDLKNSTDFRMEAGSSLPTSKAARQAFIMDMMKMGFIDPNKGLELMEIGGVQKLYEQLRVDERQAQRENLKMKGMDPAELEKILAARNMLGQVAGNIQGMIQQQTAAIPPEAADIFAPQPGQNPMDGNLAMAGQDITQMQIPGMETDPTTGQPILPPLPVPVNTWDNHAVHIEVHNRFRKGQAFEALSEAHKQLFEEHVKTHADALNQSAMAAGPEMAGGMGVPPLSQSEGGQPPDMMGPPNG